MPAAMRPPRCPRRWRTGRWARRPRQRRRGRPAGMTWPARWRGDRDRLQPRRPTAGAPGAPTAVAAAGAASRRPTRARRPRRHRGRARDRRTRRRSRWSRRACGPRPRRRRRQRPRRLRMRCREGARIERALRAAPARSPPWAPGPGGSGPGLVVHERPHAELRRSAGATAAGRNLPCASRAGPGADLRRGFRAGDAGGRQPPRPGRARHEGVRGERGDGAAPPRQRRFAAPRRRRPRPRRARHRRRPAPPRTPRFPRRRRRRAPSPSPAAPSSTRSPTS